MFVGIYGSGIQFIKGLIDHNWNLVKSLYALFFYSDDLIVSQISNVNVWNIIFVSEQHVTLLWAYNSLWNKSLDTSWMAYSEWSLWNVYLYIMLLLIGFQQKGSSAGMV